jgi:hypothetical protein
MKMRIKKRGTEAADAIILKLFEVVIAAVMILIAIVFIVNIVNSWNKESKGTQESMNNLFTVINSIASGSDKDGKASVLLNINDDYYLLAFSSTTMATRYGSVDSTPENVCGGTKCLCICNSPKCDKNIVDCKRWQGTEINTISYFAVPADPKPSNNFVGSDYTGSGGKYMAIAGRAGRRLNLWIFDIGGTSWGLKPVYLRLYGDALMFSDNKDLLK